MNITFHAILFFAFIKIFSFLGYEKLTVRRITTHPDKLFDTVARVNCDIPALLQIDSDILQNIREITIRSQIVNVSGPYIRCVKHSWAYDLLPWLLVRCSQLSTVSIELESVSYPHVGLRAADGILFPLEYSPGVMLLHEAGLISTTGLSWCYRNSANGKRCIRLNEDEFDELKRNRPRFLSRASITASGYSRESSNFEIYSVVCMFQQLGLFDILKSLEVRKFSTSYLKYAAQPLFSSLSYGHGAPLSSITDLDLECGEENEDSLNVTLSRLENVFPNLKSLSLKKIGLFVRPELSFLARQEKLRHLTITELSSPMLDAEEGLDSIYATNLLVESMHYLLIPEAIRTLKWIRAGHQEFYADVTWVNKLYKKKIEDVDVWFKYNGEWVMQGERYYAWDFHQELYYGTGTEDGWGQLWVERFMCEL
ncbi:hypothetical protein TWF694_003735 [Orbilia ellipsospora]|uniref:Uncharacterized protein n=1 Tax=Orbilia ellipsospora TaxID=2528407 RepID=A0AAV9WZ39_9PEZI